MINPENVPEPVWRAAMSAYHKTLRKNPAMAWQEAVVAALGAWPDKAITPWQLSENYRGHEIRLPITDVSPWSVPQENSDR